MRIGINASLLTAPAVRGWNRYTVNLISQLATMDIDLFLYSRIPIHEDHLKRIRKGRVHIKVQPSPSHFSWEQRWLPEQALRDKVQILHSPFNYGLPLRAHCPKILTLHDAIDQIYIRPKQKISDKFKMQAISTSFYHWVARTSADKIITVSKSSKSDLIKYLKIKETKIEVIYEAADSIFHHSEEEQKDIRRQNNQPHPYFFYVGGWEPRKNLAFLIRSFAQAKLPEVDLVLAGGAEDEISKFKQLARELGISNQVIFKGRISDSELRVLYTNSLSMVYPSEYEGFGLQLCEAMSSGCAVIASRASSLPEILGGGGETFSLADPRELCELLKRISTDSLYRTELQHRAKTRALDFSWHKAALKTAELYEQLIENAQ